MDEDESLQSHVLCAHKIPLSRDFLYSLLDKCIKKKDIYLSRKVHSLIIFNGFQSIAVLGNILIRYFSSVGCLLDANLVFCHVLQPTLHTWHAVVSAHSNLGQSEVALQLFRRMQEDGIRPDKVLYLPILKACGNLTDFDKGCLVHEQIVRNRFEVCTVIQSALIDMYAKCAQTEDAQKVLDNYAKRDVVLWGTMISAYVHAGQAFLAIELYQKMQNDDICPDKVTFLCILKAISSTHDVLLGSMLHHEIIIAGYDCDVVVGSSLVDMYAKCSCMEDAELTFRHLPNHNIVSWNALISGYVQHGHGYSALAMYKKMQEEAKLKPEKVTFLSLLKACGIIQGIEEGRVIHDQVIRNGFDMDILLRNSVIDMYAKCGSITEAHKTFSTVCGIEAVTWNTIIGGYIQQGNFEVVIGLFKDMQCLCVLPDEVTYSCALRACAGKELLDLGRVIHIQVSKTGLEVDIVVGSALVDMYCKCQSLSDGWKVFNTLQNRNIVSWNAIIYGHANCGHDCLAIELLENMIEEGIRPSNVTFSCILKSCGNLGNIESIKLLHDGIIRCGFEIDEFLVCTLVDTYAKCGYLRESEWAFDRLPNRKVGAWAAMIAAYVQHGDSFHALELFHKMQEQNVKPDLVTCLCVLKAATSLNFIDEGRSLHDKIVREKLETNQSITNTLVDMYAKCGMLYDASLLFDRLLKRDFVSWGAMITGYVQNGDAVRSLELFEEMEKEGNEPEVSTFLSILKACANMVAHKQGKLVHDKIVKQSFDSELAIGNALVQFYAKCSCMEEANRIFRMFSSRDVAFWNVMVAGYAVQGKYDKVKDILLEMKQHNISHDARTYTSILATCGHAGEVEEGVKLFHSMGKNSSIKPRAEHFNCMIDALARSGCLEDAKETLYSMPVLPDDISWVSLLNSCKTHGNPRLANDCFDKVAEVDTGYFLKSNNCVDSHSFVNANSQRLQNSDLSFFSNAQKQTGMLNAKHIHTVCDGYLNPKSTVKKFGPNHGVDLYLVKGLSLHEHIDTERILVKFPSNFKCVNMRRIRLLRLGGMSKLLFSKYVGTALNLIMVLESKLSNKPSRRTYNQLVSVCAKGKDIKGAFEMLSMMEKAGLKPVP